MRIEKIGSATLYLGDCREILPTLGRVDAIVTDPPYGIGADKKNAHSSIRDDDSWADTAWDTERPAREVFDIMLAGSKHQIIWGGNYFADMLPATMQWLVWDKGVRGFSLADCEFAWSSQQKAARIFTIPRSKTIQDGKKHPTQKSVALMAWCLDFVKDAKTICDPFMGSGTTGVAALRAGRTFIGIEREPQYFEIACSRLRGAEMQASIFADESQPQPVMEQASIFE